MLINNVQLINMSHRCFISCKTEDFEYKKKILEDCGDCIIDHSLHDPIDSTDEDYIMRKIREDYLSDSTVTIHLIGPYSAENRGWEEQKYIKRELQASLYHGAGNTQNGILGIVLPSMYASVFKGNYICIQCRNVHGWVALNDTTTIKEFSANYYIPNDKCFYPAEDRYCILVTWDEFIVNPDTYIESAFQKRLADIAGMVTVRP